MTNGDWIRSLNNKQLAEFLAEEQARISKPVFDYFGVGVETQVVYVKRLAWLNQEDGGGCVDSRQAAENLSRSIQMNHEAFMIEEYLKALREQLYKEARERVYGEDDNAERTHCC